MTRTLSIVIILLITLILVAFLTSGNFEARDGRDVSIVRISLLCGYLLLISGGVYTAFRTNISQMLKYIAVWIAIAGILALVYQVTH